MVSLAVPPFVELQGGNAQALLVDLRVGETLASGNAATDVRVVTDGADIRERGALVEHRLEQVDVGEMLGPFVRVVRDEDIAGADIVSVPGETAAERGRHAAEMNRVAHALADEVPLGGEDGGREVPAESNDGRASGLIERDRHGVGDPFERVPHDLEAGRVEVSRHRPPSAGPPHPAGGDYVRSPALRLRSSGPRMGGPRTRLETDVRPCQSARPSGRSAVSPVECGRGPSRRAPASTPARGRVSARRRVGPAPRLRCAVQVSSAYPRTREHGDRARRWNRRKERSATGSR